MRTPSLWRGSLREVRPAEAGRTRGCGVSGRSRQRGEPSVPASTSTARLISSPLHCRRLHWLALGTGIDEADLTAWCCTLREVECLGRDSPQERAIAWLAE